VCYKFLIIDRDIFFPYTSHIEEFVPVARSLQAQEIGR
jgi:hypothetical protein